MSLPTLTRRALLAGAGTVVASAALAAPYVSAAHSEEVCSLPVDAAARFEAARAEYRAAAEALYPNIDDWNDRATENGVCLIGLCPPKPVEFTGYGVYEFTLNRKRRNVSPIAALTASESGDGYYWQLCWRRPGENGYRFQGKVHFVRTADVTIKRKIAVLA